MSRYLIPRLSTHAAGSRFQTIERQIRAGSAPHDLPYPGDEAAACVETGGRAADLNTLETWRASVLNALGDEQATDTQAAARYSAILGRTLAATIRPIPADAGHDGVWSYLALDLLPDVVLKRWPPNSDGTLSKDRWIGAPFGRDRNYLKAAWWRWTVFGTQLLEGPQLLGEDELTQLTERSSLARNPRLLRIAATAVLTFDGSQRMGFTRELVKRLTWRTGTHLLDVLSDDELHAMVSDAVREVRSRPLTRRALRNPTPP